MEVYKRVRILNDAKKEVRKKGGDLETGQAKKESYVDEKAYP